MTVITQLSGPNLHQKAGRGGDVQACTLHQETTSPPRGLPRTPPPIGNICVMRPVWGGTVEAGKGGMPVGQLNITVCHVGSPVQTTYHPRSKFKRPIDHYMEGTHGKDWKQVSFLSLIRRPPHTPNCKAFSFLALLRTFQMSPESTIPSGAHEIGSSALTEHHNFLGKLLRI